MDIAVTKLSSKGQVVIPLGDQLILKKASDLGKNFEEDLTFAKRTEDALKRYEKGLYKEMNARDFAAEIEEW
ncbi:AbrB family transcriptional regulator [Methanosarcinales archaeon ex4572_44]|nr:MAG: AbrB family transcriptional regulator [Methanosarcinales archaeon ex4572_44]